MKTNEHEGDPLGEAHETPSGADTTIPDPELDSDGRRLGTLSGGANIDSPRLYGDFIDSSKNLEEKFQDFSQKILVLGSGHGLSKSSIGVRKGLEYMRKCFENEKKPIVKRKGRVPKPPSPGGPKAQPQETNRSTSLLKLSSSLSAFSIALTDYDDYFESKTYSAIKSFQKEVLILSEALSYFSSGLEDDRMTPELDSLIRNRISTAINQFENAEEALLRFVHTGIPCIQIAQERTSSMMLNASTVATFFAGVAATTLQYTGIDIGTTSGRAIQTLWFSSLVLSIGSAITSLLVFAWRQAVSSRTQRRLPMYIRFWSRSGYLVLLSASIIAFISGLIAYVYALQRTRAMFWVVTACTAFCAIGLADVLRCYATDQWGFWKSIKTRALAHDVTTDKQSTVIWERLKNISLLSILRHFNRHTLKGWHTTRRLRIRLWGAVRDFLCSCYARRDAITHNLPDMEPGQQMPESDNTVDCTVLIQSLSSQDLDFSHHAGKIYDMQFSPGGEWLVVCTTSSCYAYEVYTSHYQFLDYYVQQVKWSPDGKRLLTRTKHGIGIWSLKNDSHFRVFELENNIKPGKSLVDLEWSDNNKFIALSNDADSMFTVHMDNGQQKLMEIRLLPSGLTIYEMTTMNHSTFILLLATRKVKYVPEEKGISCIIVYDMESSKSNDTHPKSTSWWQSNSVRQLADVGKIKSKVPLSKKAKGIAAGVGRTRLVVTYEKSMPEVWSIDKDNGTISRRCELILPETKSKGKGVWGSASFVGSGENLVACAEDGIVHFWKDIASDFRFQHIHSLTIHGQDEDEHDSNSDYDSDDDSDDDEKGEGTVFAWKFRSGVFMMASGYLRDLKLWSP